MNGLRILILIFFNVKLALCQIVIDGRISGYDGKSLVYYRSTVEGIYTPYWKEIKPSGKGVFRIKYSCEGFGNTTITYRGMTFRFFHDTNSKIQIEFIEPPKSNQKRIRGDHVFVFLDSLKKLSSPKITGDYREINQFYNSNLRTTYFTTRQVDGNYYSSLIYKASTTDQALNRLDSLMQIEVDQINKLPFKIDLENPSDVKKKKEISEYLKNEVYAFYGGVFLNGMFLKRKEQVTELMKDSTKSVNAYSREWEVLVEKLCDLSVKIKPIPSSPDYMDFIEAVKSSLSSYRQYYFPQAPSDQTLDDIVRNRLLAEDTTWIKDDKTKFAYVINGLDLYLNNQLHYSPALLNAVYEVQSKYPNSENIQFYQNKIKELEKGLEESNTELKGIKIIKHDYSNFNDLLHRFAGKNLFIDIWASWCSPCIAEFQHRSVIQPYLDKGDLEVLYISIDKPEWEERWKRSVRINKLIGNHYRGDDAFIKDMWESIGGYKGLIPRYVLVAKDGAVYIAEAKALSEGQGLVDQIESLISR